MYPQPGKCTQCRHMPLLLWVSRIRKPEPQTYGGTGHSGTGKGLEVHESGFDGVAIFGSQLEEPRAWALRVLGVWVFRLRV